MLTNTCLLADENIFHNFFDIFPFVSSYNINNFHNRLSLLFLLLLSSLFHSFEQWRKLQRQKVNEHIRTINCWQNFCQEAIRDVWVQFIFLLYRQNQWADEKLDWRNCKWLQSFNSQLDTSALIYSL